MTEKPAPAPLPPLALVGLALLGVPRVILHDLHLLHEGTALNLLFVLVAPLAWIGVALWCRVPRPFLSLLAVGAIHGVLLALTHQVLWSTAFAGEPPRLGGSLSDLDDTVQALIVRSFAVLSSVVTGTVVGAITGLVAWGLSRLRPDPLPAR